jgi:translation elongation factor EF-1alpha
MRHWIHLLIRYDIRDEVEWSEQIFDEKTLEVSKLVRNATCVPCSELTSDNFVDLSVMPAWYASRFQSTGGSIPEHGTLLAAIDQISPSK